MGLVKSDAPEVLNFVITGQLRSGASAIQRVVNKHIRAVCHAELLHPDNATRRACHESYFGESGNTPDWLVDGHISGEQYLSNKIFDNALNGERVIGVEVPYPHIYAHDMWDYFADRCTHGDFCLIQVKRNPIACFMSLQEEKYREGCHSAQALGGSASPDIFPAQIDLDELVYFVRHQAAADEKVSRICDDRLEIDYAEIILDYPNVMEQAMSFLDIPLQRYVLMDEYRKNKSVRTRSLKWEYLRTRVPDDIRVYFEDEKIH
jgi:hypothetical protein